MILIESKSSVEREKSEQQLSNPHKGIWLWKGKLDREIKYYNTRKENKVNREPMQ